MNLEKSEEATNSKGIVLFAYNTAFDYVRIANLAAALTKRFISYPVTLITDVEGSKFADLNFIDSVIVHESTSGKTNYRGFRLAQDEKYKKVEWKNLTRADVYDLSPYDETLLLDSDYLLFSDNLGKLFGQSIDFTCYNSVLDVTGNDVFCGDARLNHYSIPMIWATAVYFKKSEFAESIFAMMKEVQANYQYYAMAYGFQSSPFRNDFALSIAHHALSGYSSKQSDFIPGQIATLSSQFEVIDFKTSGELLFKYKQEKKFFVNRTKDLDLHIMDKTVFQNERIYDNMMTYATSY